MLAKDCRFKCAHAGSTVGKQNPVDLSIHGNYSEISNHISFDSWGALENLFSVSHDCQIIKLEIM